MFNSHTKPPFVNKTTNPKRHLSFVFFRKSRNLYITMLSNKWPYLVAKTNLDSFRIDIYGFHREIDADRVAMSFDVVARFETLHNAGLARPAIPDKDHFEQEVECVIRGYRHQRGWISCSHVVLQSLVWVHLNGAQSMLLTA